MHQPDPLHTQILIHGLGHVPKGQGGDAHRRQRFHLDTGPRGRRDSRLDPQAIGSGASLGALGLLASGALLMAVAEKDWGTALAALAEAGIEASRIGAMVKQEAGVIMDGRARIMKVPRFARDEVARFLAG